MKYKIVDLIIEYNAKYNVLKKRSEKYIISDEEKTDVFIPTGDADIERVQKENTGINIDFAEYMLLESTFYTALLSFNGCLLHSSAVVVDNEAYLFSANCGTGKSTHTELWKKYLRDKNPYILNDDKPAIRIMEDGIFAYGTPFCGKNDINENKKVPLKAICFLEQSKINYIRKVDKKEAVELFFEQTFRKIKEEDMLKFFDVLDIILKEIPIYKLYCDMSEEAVQLSYNTMKGDNTNEN